MKTTKLDESLLKATFKLVNGYLWRKVKDIWRPVNISITDRRYLDVGFKGGTIRLHKVVMILKLDGNIPDGLVVDHIDNVRHNNHVDNLQLLNNRDNSSKDVVYSPVANTSVRFRIDKVSLQVGSFPKESDRELVWNAMAKYCLFRQGLEQPARDRLLELIDNGEVKTARLVFKKLVQFELANLNLGV